MHRTTASTTSVLALVAVLALSACSGSGKSAASKGASQTNGLTPATSSSAASGALTAAQLKKVLPKVSDLPKGWTVDPTGTLTGNMTLVDRDGVTPASCSTASQVQQNFNFVEPSTAHVNIDFVAGQRGPFSGTTVYSFAAPYPASAFAAIRASVTKCASYSETEDDGSQVPDHVSLIPVPVVGDGSLALEVRSIFQNVDLDLVIVLVRSGNTLIAVEDAGAGTPASLTRAAQLAQTTLTRLTKA